MARPTFSEELAIARVELKILEEKLKDIQKKDNLLHKKIHALYVEKQKTKQLSKQNAELLNEVSRLQNILNINAKEGLTIIENDDENGNLSLTEDEGALTLVKHQEAPTIDARNWARNALMLLLPLIFFILATTGAN